MTILIAPADNGLYHYKVVIEIPRVIETWIASFMFLVVKNMTDMNYEILLLIQKNHANMGALSISPLVVY